MKSKTLLATAFTLISLLSPVSATSTWHSIHSTGFVTYSSTSEVSVDGKYLKSGSERFSLHGLNLWNGIIFEDWREYLSTEVIQRVKDWNFNAISIITPWRRIEPSKDQVGAYDEEDLQDIEEIIGWCKDVDLYVIISLRAYGMWWAATHNWGPCAESIDYLLTAEGQQRYQDFLAMMIQRFDPYANVIGFNGWFFPFHGYTGKWTDPAWTECYYDVYTPIIVNTIREYSDKTIFYSPCYQGGTPAGDPFTEVCDTGQFSLIQPLDDNNVVYCHRFHRGRGVSGNNRGVENGEEWDYDYAFVESQMDPGIDFMNAYDVPLCACEFGLRTQDVEITKSRLDCQDYKFQLMNHTGSYHWTYWMLGDGPTILNEDYTLNEVGEQVVSWAQSMT